MHFLSDEEIDEYKMFYPQIAPDLWHISQVYQFEPGFAITRKSQLVQAPS